MNRKIKDVPAGQTPAGELSTVTTTAPNASPDTKHRPIKTFALENIGASVFAREHTVRGQMKTFYSVSVTRSYKDAEGKTHYAKSFDPEDLPSVMGVIRQVSEYLANPTPSQDATHS